MKTINPEITDLEAAVLWNICEAGGVAIAVAAVNRGVATKKQLINILVSLRTQGLVTVDKVGGTYCVTVTKRGRVTNQNSRF